MLAVVVVLFVIAFWVAIDKAAQRWGVTADQVERRNR